VPTACTCRTTRCASADSGKKATDLAFGSLTFTPSVTGAGLGYLTWTAGRVTPVMSRRNPYQLHARKRRIAQHGIVFEILPPVSGGTYLTVQEAT